MYKFTEQQTSLLEAIRAVKAAIVAQPPSSPTRTLLLDTYDIMFNQLAGDIGSSIIKPKLQKVIV